jgi:hypothetical protein
MGVHRTGSAGVERHALSAPGVVALLWTLAAACGGQEAGSAGPKDLLVACSESERIECGKAEECEGGLATRVYGSVEVCTARLTDLCRQAGRALGAVDAASNIAICAANQQAQSCDEWVGKLTPGCGFVGSKPDGSPCEINGQCASGFCDQIEFFTLHNVCGVCAPPPIEGGACASACAADGELVCIHDSAGVGRCVRLGQVDEVCDTAKPCASGLRCALPDGATTGVCKAVSANLGDACHDSNGPFCDYRQGAYCEPTTLTCALPVTSETGGACGALPDDTRAVCRGGEGCVFPAAGATAGTCVPFLTDGARCGSGYGVPFCFPPAICASGTCRLVGPEICE